MKNPETLSDRNHDLSFPKTITSWDEGIPLGNGLCGALIWGTSRELRFSLDGGDLWDTTPYSGIYEEEFSYPTMVKLAGEKNIGEIRRIFDAPYHQPLPSKLPAGKLILDFHKEANVSSMLNLQNAQAQIQVGDAIQIKSFLHARQKVGMIRIHHPSSGFSWRLQRPPYGIQEETSESSHAFDGAGDSSLEHLRYPAPEVVSQENFGYFVQTIHSGFAYGLFAMTKESGADTEIAYTIASSKDGADWISHARELVANALKEGYDSLFQSHASWWEQYWNQSSLSLPDKFFEKNWYLTQYYLASCSRKGAYPMPLQGVWTADDGHLPPWKGDYHLDLNVQMTYSSYLKANHTEEGETLMDYLWEMADCAREFARTFYHSKGLCLPSTMTIDGTPLGGWGMYSLSPTNQIWTCQLMERHYRYTGDQRFLKERAYPYLSETAECILGILEKRDGHYYLPISSSPEIHDDEIESFLTPNSNYDLSLMRYLFRTLAELALQLNNGEEDKWKEILRCLPDLAVTEDGVLMVSPDEELQESHRHFSHAMAIHPLRLLSYDKEEERRIIDATILDLERLGSGYWVGFTFAWMAELYAIQHNGNGAAQQLEIFWKNYCLPNGFHANGDYKKRGTSVFHYRAFTLEGNFCAADALQEMLLQSERHTLCLFHAIPEEWEEETVSFRHFQAEDGMLVSAVLQCGAVTSLSLKPAHSGEVRLKKGKRLATLIPKIAEHSFAESEGDCLKLTLSGGYEYLFEL